MHHFCTCSEKKYSFGAPDENVNSVNVRGGAQTTAASSENFLVDAAAM